MNYKLRDLKRETRKPTSTVIKKITKIMIVNPYDPKVMNTFILANSS